VRRTKKLKPRRRLRCWAPPCPRIELLVLPAGAFDLWLDLVESAERAAAACYASSATTIRTESSP
jgi:hypothetical protein